ncbi:hypothetical protein PV518_52030, partial [Streptomyces sp. ND04-05B]|nr:hypothetical protein [Streptomyces sp. ND04-05B]
MSVLVLLLAVGAACCLGFGFVLQQQAAAHAPLGDFLSPRPSATAPSAIPHTISPIPPSQRGTRIRSSSSRGEVTLVEPILATNLL